ncbi:MAG TPA: hypothetical protein VI792_03855 [Candidatus Eisenbacteria bacterium]
MPPRVVFGTFVLAALTLVSSGCGRRGGSVPPTGTSGSALVAPEHYAYSVAALGFPGATRAFQVGAGSSVSTGETALEWRLPDETGPIRTSPVWFERDGVPVAHWWMVSERESLAFEAAAMPQREAGDSSLVLSVRVTASTRLPQAVEVSIEARVRGRPEGPGFVPWDAADDDGFDEAWDGMLAIRNDDVVAGVDPDADRGDVPPSVLHPAHVDGFGPGSLAVRCRARLVPGQHPTWTFWMPAYPVPLAVAQRIDRSLDHGRIVSAARLAWRDWLGRATRLETPDARINAAWRASLVTLIQCQERRGEDWVPIGNPFQYRDVWIRDAARTIRALAVAGLTRLARDDAWTLRAFQLPDGALISQRGQLDGTGEALWALEQAASLPPSDAYAKRVIPIAEGGLRWIERQRRASRELRLPWRGLLPYAEPRDNELTRAQLTGNDAWGLAGCRATAALARRAGRESLAVAARAVAADYRASILESLRHVRSDNIPPAWQGGGRNWGNLSFGYPTLALPAEDPRLARLAARARGGAIPGLIPYGSPDSIHTYLGADLAQWSLAAGRPAEARVALAAVLAHSSSTFGQAEIFDAATGAFASNLPPHATAAACIVDLVRNLFVCDTGDTLELALGGDLAWWEGTRIERAPTRFGVLDLAFDRPAPSRIEARWTPVSVPTRVRVPDGVRAAEALTPGARVVRGLWIEIRPGVGSVAARLVPAPRARR